MNGLYLSLIFLTVPLGASEKTLRNDSWEDGQVAGFQGGFVAGEIGAVSFFPSPQDFPLVLKKIELLFGGDIERVQQQVVVHVWKESNQLEPGLELYQDSYRLTASTQDIIVIDLGIARLSIDQGGFRVGIEFLHNGYPGIARDTDGNTHPDKNFILAEGFGWTYSSDFLVEGDWIIRAIIETTQPVFIRGEIDQNSGREITDAINLFLFLFVGGVSLQCEEAADVDNDEQLTITDGILLLKWLFLGETPPADPGPNKCGPDPDDNHLGCDRFEGC